MPKPDFAKNRNLYNWGGLYETGKNDSISISGAGDGHGGGG
jgi:hypothetical protein